MKARTWFFTLAVAVPLAGASAAPADDTAPGRGKAKDVTSFGVIRAPSVDEARGQALTWLKGVGKADATTLPKFEVIWADDERPILDRVAETLALGDAEAAKALTEARDATRAAPTAIPAALKDAKKPAFYRANLGLAFARALSNRRVHEEALEALKTVRPENVVDPAAYFFHKAVAEHTLLQKEEAGRTIIRLLDETPDAPERYKMVAMLMHVDMGAWQDKDLGAIARKMDNIERRLELARGGPQTQKMQKDVVLRLEELIKEMENQAKGSSQGNGGNCPNGGQQPGGGQQGQPGGNPNTPQQDSIGGNNSGPGQVDPKKFEALAKAWGKLPEKERAKALQNLTQNVPPKYREVIETYYRKLAQSEKP